MTACDCEMSCEELEALVRSEKAEEREECGPRRQPV